MWPLLPSGRYTGGFWEPWGMMLRAGLSVNQVAPDLLALGLSVLACDVESRDTRTKPIQPNQRGPWKDYPACDPQPLRAAWLPALHKVTWWTFPLKERGRQLNIQRSLFASVLSKRLAEARSQGFSPGLPLFGLSPLPPRKHVSRKLAKVGDQPSTLIWDADVLTAGLHACLAFLLVLRTFPTLSTYFCFLLAALEM